MELPRKPFRLPESRVHPPRPRGYRTEHISLVGRVDLARQRLEATASIRVVPNGEPLRRVELDAVHLEVRRVLVDSKERPFEYDNLMLSVELSDGLTSAHEVVVDYATTETSRGIHFIGPDDRYPQKPLQVWTHSQPEDARFWYPCNDQPSDRSTSETKISVPLGFTCVSNGRLVSREVDGEQETFHWREDIPHSSYLNSLAIGKFEEISAESDGVALHYYFDRSNSIDAMRFFGETPRMIKVYHELLGLRFPFERYSQVTVRDFVAGGMEHVSATTMTDSRFPDERSEEDYSSTYSKPDRTPQDLVAHELVHQWFGDLVTMSDWPHAWLNEGFATYYQALYVERTRGVDEFRQNMAYKAETHFEEDEKRHRRPIVEDHYVQTEDVFDTAIYEKAAWMLHQLRYVLGDETFFRATREYLKRFAGKNASTDDLRRTMEESAGRSLAAHFEQFFMKAGYPEFEVAYSWDDAESSARLLVRQVHATDAATPVFALPCDVVFYFGGAREVFRIQVSTKEEHFDFKLKAKPEIVEFDPEEWLLKKVHFRKPYEMLRQQLRHSRDGTSRVRAARELSEYKTDDCLAQLSVALGTDGFWAVRVEAARSLGKVGTKAAIEALLGRVEDSNRRVRRAVVEGLSNFHDDRAASALRRVLMGDMSPNVQAQAALSLAKVEPRSSLKDLTAAMRIPSPNETLAEACLEAIGGLKEEGVEAVLDASLEYGLPTRVRLGALKGLEERGFLTEKEVAVLREILLKDRQFSVRLQVVSVVAKLVDRRFVVAMQRASERDDDPRVRRRALEAIYELTRRGA